MHGAMRLAVAGPTPPAAAHSPFVGQRARLPIARHRSVRHGSGIAWSRRLAPALGAVGEPFGGGSSDEDPADDIDPFLAGDDEALELELDGNEDKELDMLIRGKASDPSQNDDEDDEDILFDDDDEDDDFQKDRPSRARAFKPTFLVEDDELIGLDDVVAEALKSGNGAAAAGGAAAAFDAPGPSPPTAATAAAADAPPTAVDYAYNLPEPPPRARSLRDLLAVAGFAAAAADAPQIEIRDIVSCNSTVAKEGALYVCVNDEDEPSIDGHAYADEATEMGAVAVLASRPLPGCMVPVVVVDDLDRAMKAIADEFYDRPLERVDELIALVGSHGKTTTAWFIRGMLEEAGMTVGMIGDSEYAVGMARLTPDGDVWQPEPSAAAAADRAHSAPFSVAEYAGRYELPRATPNALDLRKCMAAIVDRGELIDRDAAAEAEAGADAKIKTAVLLEVDPAATHDGRLDGVRPSVVVFTNVDEAAAAAHPGGRAGYEDAIRAMFSGLDEGQSAVINTDTEFGRQLHEMVGEEGGVMMERLLTYGLETKTTHVHVEKYKPTIWEFETTVRAPVGVLEMIIRMIGRHNLANVMAAVGAGVALAVEPNAIGHGIEAVDIVPGRSEIVEESAPDDILLKIYPKSAIPRQNFVVVVDAARSPAQLTQLLDEASEAGARRTILVIGCPGGTSPEHRAEIASIAHKRAQIALFTNDSPGLDCPEEIIRDMVAGLPDDVVGRHAGAAYPWLQDSKRCPQWFEPWILRYQAEVGRYIIEDRFSAIRVAIGMAKRGDVVIIAGRGDQDAMEYWDGLPPPRSAAEREAGAAAAAAAGQWVPGREGEEETAVWREEALAAQVDEHWAAVEAAGLAVQPGTIQGWFDDRKEARTALLDWQTVLERPELRDLDRSVLPWTRYPEERMSALSGAKVREAGKMAPDVVVDEYLAKINMFGKGEYL